MSEENPNPLCCNEGGCRRAKPFLFTKTPDNRWLLVTRWRMLKQPTEDSGGQLEVLERHDVTHQMETILLQYRAFLDAELEKAMQLASEAALEQAEREAKAPKLYLPGGDL